MSELFTNDTSTQLNNALTVSGTTSLNNATINGAYTYSAGLGVPVEYLVAPDH